MSAKSPTINMATKTMRVRRPKINRDRDNAESSTLAVLKAARGEVRDARNAGITAETEVMATPAINA